MKLKIPKKCGCGKVYANPPDDARTVLTDVFFGLMWDCECGSSLYTPEPNVEEWEKGIAYG